MVSRACLGKMMAFSVEIGSAKEVFSFLTKKQTITSFLLPGTFFFTPAKNALSEQFVFKNDPLTKTGSGQTQEKVRKEYRNTGRTNLSQMDLICLLHVTP